MLCRLRSTSLLLLLALSTSAVLADFALEAPLAADDECLVRETGRREGCGVSALQLHGQRKPVGAAAEGTPAERSQDAEDEAGTAPDVKPVGNNGTRDNEPTPEDEPEEKPQDQPEEKPQKAGAYQQCGGLGWKGPSECVDGYSCWLTNEYYGQCKPASQTKKDWVTYHGSAALNKSSDAPLLTFYMYRAEGPNNYPIQNVNTASLGGLMWYVHNEVVSCAYGDCEYVRRFGINRIVRYKVQTRAPQPLFDAGMNFGLRYAYDHGQCTGPWECEPQFEKYGYFVGCNNLSSGFPFPNWPVYYAGVWYSLPGPCSAEPWEEQGYLCQLAQPGGRCKGEPTGVGSCTYSIVEEAGEITIDELEGIEDYRAFKEEGGEEYNKTTDEGVNMTFWNEINSTVKNAERVKKANDLFIQKYPHLPSDEEFPTPTCDFDKPRFFPDGLPSRMNAHSRVRKLLKK